MKRKLLSTNFLPSKIGAVFALIIALLLPVAIIIKHAGYGFLQFWIFFFGIAVYNFWWTFNKTHPVYFDDNCISWNSKGKEQLISYTKIDEFNIKLYKIPSAELKYYDESNQIRRIRFLIWRSMWGSATEILGEFKEIVQVKKPDFKIIREGMFGDSEI